MLGELSLILFILLIQLMFFFLSFSQLQMDNADIWLCIASPCWVFQFGSHSLAFGGDNCVMITSCRCSGDDCLQSTSLVDFSIQKPLSISHSLSSLLRDFSAFLVVCAQCLCSWLGSYALSPMPLKFTQVGAILVVMHSDSSWSIHHS